MFAALPPQAKDGLYLNGCWCIYISWTLVIFYPLRFHPRTHWENGTMPERSMPWRYSIWDGKNPCRRRVRWVADSPWKWMTPLEQMVMAQADLARMVACSVLIYDFTDNILITRCHWQETSWWNAENVMVRPTPFHSLSSWRCLWDFCAFSLQTQWRRGCSSVARCFFFHLKTGLWHVVL